MITTHPTLIFLLTNNTKNSISIYDFKRSIKCDRCPWGVAIFLTPRYILLFGLFFYLLFHFWLMVSSLITFILEENSFRVRDLLPLIYRFGWNKCSLKVSILLVQILKVYLVTQVCLIITYNNGRPFGVICGFYFIKEIYTHYIFLRIA